ncbi:MAG: type II secretion system minor pseudopilin GspK [Proteobacteria bacterium]|nr:type II secretion system minor pseudopilin GspK [Pseudomonadota bacterium]
MIMGQGRRGEQRGIALISILLVVVIATVLSVSMIRHQNLIIHQVRNGLQMSQASQYALGGEELARQILWQDLADTGPVDYLTEKWAAPNMLFEFEDGEVNIQIIDLHSRLNINSLLAVGPVGQVSRARFAALLAVVGLDASYLDRLVDWIDADGAVNQLGAEDYEYLGLDRPYRAANQPMTEISELRLIVDMNAEGFAALEPYLCALPTAGAPINVNTADAAVLQSLAPGLTPGLVDQLIGVRDGNGGFETVTEFLQSPYLAGLGVPEAGLGVQSAFFEVRVRARYLDRYGYLTSVIERNTATGVLRVVYRNVSRRIAVPEPELMETPNV